jgi:rhodanese-related sulfurtransferase
MRLSRTLLAILLPAALAGCAGLEIRAVRIRTLDLREAAALASRPETVIVDARSLEEYAAGHVPRARLAPLTAEFADVDAPVLVYDADGRRSFPECLTLKHEGFNEVYELRGGFRAWSEAGLPVEAMIRLGAVSGRLPAGS